MILLIGKAYDRQHICTPVSIIKRQPAVFDSGHSIFTYVDFSIKLLNFIVIPTL